MTLQFSKDLEEYSKRRSDRFRSLQGREVPRSTTQVHAYLVENVRSKAEASGHVWFCDGSKERAGTNQAPGPLQYFLSSMAFCQLTHYAENAALMGIVLEGVEMTVKGQFNPLPGNGYETIEFETRVLSTESPSRILELAERAERECYVTNTLKKAARVTGRVFLNGKVLAERSPVSTSAPQAL